MTVRTRIAPSPTGDPHVGTAYIALFNYCFARQHGGQFIVRIEDTDQQRSTPESELAIMDSLRWLGMSWDEGPDLGGYCGPYRQSERGDIYRQYAEQLVSQGDAFYCYRTPEELDQLREQRKEQGGHLALKPSDLILSEQEQNKRKAEGAPYVIRMMVPEDESRVVIKDRLRGEIELDWGQVDAQILLKSDGMPTYHLANVVDDHLMEITHVIRGEEWINSAPKHKLLYQYFGWEMPELCHLPLLRNPDKSKLSKRKNPTSILYYKQMGFMPEALLNYLARMGWSMPDEREKFTLEEMLGAFDIDRVSLGGPIFDQEKLRWLNGCWIREELNVNEFADAIAKWAFNRENLMPLIPHIQQRVEAFSDVAPLVAFMFSGMLPLKKADFLDVCKQDEDELLRVLQFVLWRLESLRHWDKDEIFNALKSLADSMGLKIRDLLPAVFVAIAGTTSTISVMDAMALLGPDVSRARVRSALETFGGVGKKRLKKLEKEYQQFS